MSPQLIGALRGHGVICVSACAVEMENKKSIPHAVWPIPAVENTRERRGELSRERGRDAMIKRLLTNVLFMCWIIRQCCPKVTEWTLAPSGASQLTRVGTRQSVSPDCQIKGCHRHRKQLCDYSG